MECKACGKKLKVDDRIRQQGWTECSSCHAIFSIPRDESSPLTPPPEQQSALDPAPAPDMPEIPRTLGELKAAIKKEGSMSSFVTRMQEAMLKQAGKTNTPAPGPRKQVAMPKGMTVNHGDGSMVITRHWFSMASVFMFVFVFMWIVMLFIMFNVIGSGAEDSGEPIVFLLFPVLGGALLVYKIFCDLLNSTDITVSKDSLEVRHGPLPWPGKRQLNTRGISQIYVRKKESTSKNGTTVTYAVLARTSDGNDQTILGSLSSADQAVFLEQSIESYLGITDQWVEGSHT